MNPFCCSLYLYLRISNVWLVPWRKNFLFRTSLAPILEQEVLSRFRSKMATGTFQAWINTDRMYLSNIFLKLLRHTTLPLEAKKDWWRQLPGHGKSSSLKFGTSNGSWKWSQQVSAALNPARTPRPQDRPDGASPSLPGFSDGGNGLAGTLCPVGCLPRHGLPTWKHRKSYGNPWFSLGNVLEMS